MLTTSPFAQNRNRIIYLTTGLLACSGISWLLVAPDTKSKVGSDYQYMHCKTCRTERAYDSRFAELKCLKCSPQKDAGYVPTVASINGPGSNPWKWFSIAVALEAIIFLGLLAYLMSPRSVAVQETFLYCNCPSCKWRLRFRERSAGKDGACPRCKRTFRFPELEQADEHEHPALQKPMETWPE